MTNDRYHTDLVQFFSRAEKLNKKKQYKFVTENKEFKLVDDKNVTVLRLTRRSKKDVLEEIKKKEAKIENQMQKILSKKYRLLFEYEDVENYANIFKQFITPLEKSIQKQKKYIVSVQNEQDRERKRYEESLRNINMELEAYREELKNDSQVDKTRKKEFMNSYIEKQQELYETKTEYNIYLNTLKETSM